MNTTEPEAFAALAVADPGLSAEEKLMLLDRAKCVMRELAEKVKRFEAEVVTPAVAERGGVMVGPIRWYVAREKDTRCVSVAEALEAALAAAGGDVAQVAACLAANAWKPGACRKALPPDVFGRLFVTTEKQVLRDGRAAGPKLASVDTRFIEAAAGE